MARIKGVVEEKEERSGKVSNLENDTRTKASFPTISSNHKRLYVPCRMELRFLTSTRLPVPTGRNDANGLSDCSVVVVVVAALTVSLVSTMGAMDTFKSQRKDPSSIFPLQVPICRSTSRNVVTTAAASLADLASGQKTISTRADPARSKSTNDSVDIRSPLFCEYQHTREHDT